MLQLAYISTVKGAVDQALLESILSVSRRNNARDGVSGLLVSGGRRFLQVLEGPEEKVLAAYARIQADSRHRGFVLITCRNIDERAFGDWEMAYREGGAAEADGALEKAVADLVGKIEDLNLRAQFMGFAQLHSRAA